MEVGADALFVVLAASLPLHAEPVDRLGLVHVLACTRPVEVDQLTGAVIEVLLLTSLAEFRRVLHLLHLLVELPLGPLDSRLVVDPLLRPVVLDVAPHLAIHHGLVELAHDSAVQVVAAAADAGGRKVAGVAGHSSQVLVRRNQRASLIFVLSWGVQVSSWTH